ncbi:Fanconi anemia group B protein-like protein [Trichoplax sp. H2]|nr:Fanconi anemia group B protein-like protein [Trichoplax sp. H2]|eukprot:RDD37965.1 Fanconi anemia group B protein-like protein [Trichoplax sp. H2]
MAPSSAFISSYCGFLLHFTFNQNDNKNVQITLQCFQLYHGVQWNCYGQSYSLSWENSSCHSQIINTANNVLDYLTHTQKCYLALLQQNDHASATCYLIQVELVDQPRLVPIRRWFIPQFLWDKNIQIAILNGPSIYLIDSSTITILKHDLNHENGSHQIHQLNNPFLGQRQLSTPVVDHASHTDLQLPRYCCFLQSFNLNTKHPIDAIGKVEMSSNPSYSSSAKQKCYKLQSINLNIETTTPTVLDSDSIIPDIYCNILTCFTLVSDLHQLQVLTKSYTANRMNTSDTNYIIFACTSQCQLVEFLHAKLVRLYKIPFGNAIDVACVMIEGNNYIWIKSADDHICIINHQTQQIIENRSNVRHVLIDDFAGLGHDQILFLFEDYPGVKNFNEHFALLDLNDFISRKSEESVNQEHAESKSVKYPGQIMAIKALDARIQNLAAQLHELRCKLKQKQDFAAKTLQLVSQIGNGLPPSPVVDSTDLFTLIDGSEELGSNDNKTSKINLGKVIISIKHWTVTDDRLIIAFEIDNKSESYLSSIAIVLVSNDNESRTTITLPVPNIRQTEETLIPSDAKRQKISAEADNSTEDDTINSIKPGTKVQIVTVTELPNFILTDYCDIDILCALKQDFTEETVRNFLVCYGGTIRLTPDDFMKHNSTSPQLEICSCLKLSEANINKVAVELLVHLNHINNNDIVENMIGKLKLSHDLQETLTTSDHKKQSTLLPMSKTLVGSSGLRFTIFTSDGKTFNIKIFARDFRLLALILRLVVSFLPNDSFIRPKILESASFKKVIEAASDAIANYLNPSFNVHQQALKASNDKPNTNIHLKIIDDDSQLVKCTDKILLACIFTELIKLFRD